MWKNVLFTMWFLDFVTVFNQSYNCQNSHYLGRNRVFRPFLIFLCYNSLPMTMCKLSSEHLPTLSCPRSYWMTSSCYGYFRICVFTLNVWWEIRTAETNFCFTLKTQWADFINLIRKIASLSIQNGKKIDFFSIIKVDL